MRSSRAIVRSSALASLLAMSVSVVACTSGGTQAASSPPSGAPPTASSTPSPTSSVVTATQVLVYQPWTISGKLASGLVIIKSARGSCFAGSIADERPDAWRCMEGNLILDPCISPQPGAGREVVCPKTGPWSPRVIVLHLTKPLPSGFGNPGPTGNQRRPAWVVLSDGADCFAETGTVLTVGNLAGVWACTDGHYIDRLVRSPAVWSAVVFKPGGGATVPVERVPVATLWS